MKDSVSTQILSEITTFSKYRKYLPEEQRRETWQETCDRYKNMLLKKFPQLGNEINQFMPFIVDNKILPSMRMLQFAGKAVEQNAVRGYNCSFMPVNAPEAFSETMFLLLTGTGVGYSVQNHHINQLPTIKQRQYGNEELYKTVIVQDSIEGWADAIKELMLSCFNGSKPVYFDYSQIRAKGALLITSGGKAPGPEPLKECIEKIESILHDHLEEAKKEGFDEVKLTSIICHDILCHIANAVLAGGIRRAAMIALFDKDDDSMLLCKSGNWWENNEQRGRANNSAILERSTTTEEEFMSIWKKIEDSNAGEPGISWTNNKEWGFNPCHEISLRPFQFCNLCEVNVSNIENESDIKARIRAATFFGTLQASFTDFHYLRPIWKETTEKDALIGIGMTGIASNEISKYDLGKLAYLVREVNEYYAKQIGINPAARCTTIKPSGTTSCVLGTSSGIHAWHSEYYIRTIRLGKNEALYTYLSINHPELLEDDYFRPDTQAIVNIPQQAPSGAILRENESVGEFLDRIALFNQKWVQMGHNSGDNINNVSATVSIDKSKIYTEAKVLDEPKKIEDGYSYSMKKIGEKDEWQYVGEWMWNNRTIYSGISVLPYDNGSYIQAPFQVITKEKYEELISHLKTIDLSKVVEIEDHTNFSQEAACGGNGCSV